MYIFINELLCSYNISKYANVYKVNKIYNKTIKIILIILYLFILYYIYFNNN